MDFLKAPRDIAKGLAASHAQSSTLVDAIEMAIKQARADGYFERYDYPLVSPADASERLHCSGEIVRGIYERAGSGRR